MGVSTALGAIARGGAHTGTEKPRAFSNASTEHNHQNITKRVKVGERCGHINPQTSDVVR